MAGDSERLRLIHNAPAIASSLDAHASLAGSMIPLAVVHENCSMNQIGPKRNKGETCEGLPFVGMCVRQCPTLPHPGGCSTIGAVGLSFRVRDGTGRFPYAMAAVTLRNMCVSRQSRDPLVFMTVVVISGVVGMPGFVVSGIAQWTRSIFVVSPRPISTSQLTTPYGASTSGLSTRWSSRGPYPLKGVGVLILEQASRLDAFSGYPFRT